jgi:hypothetical protein
MKSWEEAEFIINLLSQQTELEIQSNTANHSNQSIAIQVKVFYSSAMQDYVMVVHPEDQMIQQKSLNNFTNLRLLNIHSMILKSIYPIDLAHLSPLNVIDKRCREICSVLLFSQAFHESLIRVKLTHSDSILEIPFEDLKTVLRVAGAKILIY